MDDARTEAPPQSSRLNKKPFSIPFLKKTSPHCMSYLLKHKQSTTALDSFFVEKL